MSSKNLFQPCKACGKDISISEKRCPHCGQKHFRMSVGKWIGVAIFGVFIIGIFSNSDETSNPTSSSFDNITSTSSAPTNLQLPSDERTFIETVTKFINSYPNAKNELQQSSLRIQRKQALATVLNGFGVKEWTGTIIQLETNNDGKAILGVRIAPHIEIKTWNNAFSDLGFETLIDQNSNVYRTLLNAEIGQKLTFSGSFFAAEQDFISETSLTIDGSMKNPEFLFLFSSVNLID